VTWRIDRAQLDSATHRWAGLADADGGLSYERVWTAWRSDAAFREFWIESLWEVEFEAYCWECPPVTDRNRSRPFECVFVSSSTLAEMPPEPEAFADYFGPLCQTATFENLGGDALLVVPCPTEPDSEYGHLAQFTRIAPPSRQSALWQAVGEAMASRVGDAPVWLSTAGHGVAWLHIRLDSRPKYYRYAAYRIA
jgi:hypothetical protein